MKTEEWKDIPGHPNYKASSLGRIKSLERTVQRTLGKITHDKNLKEKILKQNADSRGYLRVCLMDETGKNTARVHVLVASTFLGIRPQGLVINHINGNKIDNSVDNLEYISNQKNTNKYYELIGKPAGSIPYKDIPKIIDLINNGHKIIHIAVKYGVKPSELGVLSRVINLEELKIEL